MKPYQPPKLRLIATIHGGVVRCARTGELVGGFDVPLTIELSSDDAVRAILDHEKKCDGKDKTP